MMREIWSQWIIQHLEENHRFITRVVKFNEHVHCVGICTYYGLAWVTSFDL